MTTTIERGHVSVQFAREHGIPVDMGCVCTTPDGVQYIKVEREEVEPGKFVFREIKP